MAGCALPPHCRPVPLRPRASYHPPHHLALHLSSPAPAHLSSICPCISPRSPSTGHYALELAEPPYGKPTALRRCTRFSLAALLHRHHALARGAAAARAAACAAEPLPPSLDTPGLLGAGAAGRMHARLDVLYEWRQPAQATRLRLRAPSLVRVLAPPPEDGADVPEARARTLIAPLLSNHPSDLRPISAR